MLCSVFVYVLLQVLPFPLWNKAHNDFIHLDNIMIRISNWTIIIIVCSDSITTIFKFKPLKHLWKIINAFPFHIISLIFQLFPMSESKCRIRGCKTNVNVSKLIFGVFLKAVINCFKRGRAFLKISMKNCDWQAQ